MDSFRVNELNLSDLMHDMLIVLDFFFPRLSLLLQSYVEVTLPNYAGTRLIWIAPSLAFSHLPISKILGQVKSDKFKRSLNFV